MGSHSLLQGIFPTQGSNPGLPHWRWILYQLSHKGSPRILEWVAYPFSSRELNQDLLQCRRILYHLCYKRSPKWGAVSYSRDLPNPRIKPRSPALEVDSLPAEPPGKPKDTGVGSLSLLQQIFPTQELNWGLLHFRRILYQLSYQGSPMWETWVWSLSWEDPRRRDWLSTPVFWPGEFHGLYSP